jgi:hypothetical protein
VLRLELAQLVQEVGELVQVLQRLGQHLRNVEGFAVQLFGGFEQFVGNDVFVGLFIDDAEQVFLAGIDVAEQIVVASRFQRSNAVLPRAWSCN